MRPGRKGFPSDRLNLKRLWSLLAEKPPGPIVEVKQNTRRESSKRLAS